MNLKKFSAREASARHPKAHKLGTPEYPEYTEIFLYKLNSYIRELRGENYKD